MWQKLWYFLLEIDDTGHDGYKIVSFVFGHAYQPLLQLTVCFLRMRISDMLQYATSLLLQGSLFRAPIASAGKQFLSSSSRYCTSQMHRLSS